MVGCQPPGVPTKHRNVDGAHQRRVGLQREVGAGQFEQSIRDLRHGDVGPRADVVDLAHLTAFDQQPVGDHYVSHVGEVTPGGQGSHGE